MLLIVLTAEEGVNVILSPWQSVAIWLIVAASFAWWRLTKQYGRHVSTLAGAQHALQAMAESAKWMSGIQTATLAALVWLADGTTPHGAGLTSVQRTFAIGGFVFVGLGLLCCAWVLTAIPSAMLRAHGISHSATSEEFDVHEMTMFATRSPRLGNMMALQHWFWAVGLFCVAISILVGT